MLDDGAHLRLSNGQCNAPAAGVSDNNIHRRPPMNKSWQPVRNSQNLSFQPTIHQNHRPQRQVFVSLDHEQSQYQPLKSTKDQLNNDDFFSVGTSLNNYCLNNWFP